LFWLWGIAQGETFGGSSGTANLETMKTLLMLLALSLAAVTLAIKSHILWTFIRAVVST
jgi:hypothetical protein